MILVLSKILMILSIKQSCKTAWNVLSGFDEEVNFPVDIYG